jgi:YegS/Rv2252/BmrU family lipid kinase
MTETVVILNPTAGSPEHIRSWQVRIESIARDCPVLITSQSGDAEPLARRAVEQGFTRIVAAGGDGTVNQVANGLAGSNCVMGVLPIGSVNVFAMELGLPLHNLQRCWDIIEDANVRMVDLPSANSKYFVQLAGVGLDAQVVKETSIAFKRSFGPLSYLISAAQIAARRPPKLFIESEHTSLEEGSFVLVGNGRLYGGPFPFFKHAIIDDGVFDVVIFKRLGYLEIIKYLQDVVFSSDINVPEVEYFQTRELRITCEQDVPLELDGELAGNCPVDFQIRERALRVLAPFARRESTTNNFAVTYVK